MQQTAEFAVCVKWNTSSPVFILDTISRLKVIVRSVAGDLYRTVMVDGNDRNVSMINVPEDDSYRVQIDVIMTDGRYVPGKEKILPLMRLNSTARPATETTTAETPTVNAEPRTTTFLVDNETLSKHKRVTFVLRITLSFVPVKYLRANLKSLFCRYHCNGSDETATYAERRQQ